MKLFFRMSMEWRRAARWSFSFLASGGADAIFLPPHTAPSARRALTSFSTSSSHRAHSAGHASSTSAGMINGASGLSGSSALTATDTEWPASEGSAWGAGAASSGAAAALDEGRGAASALVGTASWVSLSPALEQASRTAPYPARPNIANHRSRFRNAGFMESPVLEVSNTSSIPEGSALEGVLKPFRF